MNLNIAFAVFVVLASGCIIGAFVRGAELRREGFPRRWRKRARYLRWLSMACLSAIGALVSITFGTTATEGADSVQTAQVAVLGIVSAILVWVYRYIIKLSYFYDARADALAVLKYTDDDSIRQKLELTEIDEFQRIVKLLSPAVEGSISSAAAQLVESARRKE